VVDDSRDDDGEVVADSAVPVEVPVAEVTAVPVETAVPDDTAVPEETTDDTLLVVASPVETAELTTPVLVAEETSLVADDTAEVSVAVPADDSGIDVATVEPAVAVSVVLPVPVADTCEAETEES